MTPIPLEPFGTVRQHWGTIKPYYKNYLTSINLGNILMAFVGVIEQVIHHGFTFPRMHPAIEVEELEPSLEHPNEFISTDELAQARACQVEGEVNWGQVLDAIA
jgi:hypothetical protein